MFNRLIQGCVNDNGKSLKALEMNPGSYHIHILADYYRFVTAYKWNVWNYMQNCSTAHVNEFPHDFLSIISHI